MNMKKNITVSDTAALYPPLWGGPKRIWNLYSNLSQDLFDITYVGVSCGLNRDSKYSFKRIAENFKEILCALPPHYYFWHVFERSVFKSLSFDLFTYLWMQTDWHFSSVLNSQNADILVCSHPWPSLAMHKSAKQLFIYDAHNCEYLLMGQILKNHPFKKMILRMVKRIEGDACRKSDLVLACSENEKKDLMEIYKIDPEKIMTVTNGASLKTQASPEEKAQMKIRLGRGRGEKIIFFVGAYYKPNIDAVKYTIEKIAPELKKYKFIIAGSVKEAFKTIKSPDNVIFLGSISGEELDIACLAADIAINPMFEGSGINIKMLDYMSYGLPVVTTECGARGIETFGRSPMIISRPDDFGANIEMLIDNEALSARIASDGRSLIAEQYDWKIISDKLQKEILRLLSLR
jgi:glycosyltransferase involved in cell wall biosynthesis